MEKQLPAVRKLELIPIERRNFPKANRKRKKIQRDEVISNRVLPHTFDWKNIRRSK